MALILAATAPQGATPPAIDLTASARVQAFADCFAGNAPDFAVSAIRENWSGDRYIAELPRQLWEVCDRAGLSVGPNVLDARYAIAWALLKHGRVTTELRDFVSVPPLATAVEGGSAVRMLAPGETPAMARAAALAASEHVRVLAVTGECVVRAKSAETRALLLDAEDPAKQDALGSTFAACTPTGANVALPREALTGLLAWIYVRLALAAEVAE